MHDADVIAMNNQRTIWWKRQCWFGSHYRLASSFI